MDIAERLVMLKQAKVRQVASLSVMTKMVMGAIEQNGKTMAERIQREVVRKIGMAPLSLEKMGDIRW